MLTCLFHSTKNLYCSLNVINQLERLQRTLGYQFSNLEYLELALTHRSFSGSKNNERLEYLGDSILNFVIAEALYFKFSNAKEGHMSRLRASLVKGETLAKIGISWDLGEYLKLGSGELKSGGFRRESILADTVEAIIGAISLDQGREAARTKVLDWYADRLNELRLDQVTKDPKTQLQEFLQSRKLPLPVYHVDSVIGEPHEQIFSVNCIIDALPDAVSGTGNSRRSAEQNAALESLTQLGVIHKGRSI